MYPDSRTCSAARAGAVGSKAATRPKRSATTRKLLMDFMRADFVAWARLPPQEIALGGRNLQKHLREPRGLAHSHRFGRIEKGKPMSWNWDAPPGGARTRSTAR